MHVCLTIPILHANFLDTVSNKYFISLQMHFLISTFVCSFRVFRNCNIARNAKTEGWVLVCMLIQEVQNGKLLSKWKINKTLFHLSICLLNYWDFKTYHRTVQHRMFVVLIYNIYSVFGMTDTQLHYAQSLSLCLITTLLNPCFKSRDRYCMIKLSCWYRKVFIINLSITASIYRKATHWLWALSPPHPKNRILVKLCNGAPRFGSSELCVACRMYSLGVKTRS